MTFAVSGFGKRWTGKLLVLGALTAALYGQPAEQVYKNIVQLKGVPADQVLPAMQVMSAALGVECGFCHVPGKPEADEKAPKKTAREMIAMMTEINKTHFHGQQQVTCFTCHHGIGHPASVPPVQESDAPARTGPVALATGTPMTAEAIIEKWVAAVGGADAIRKQTSRVMSGKIMVGGSENPIEVIAKAPNKRVSISHTSNGASYTAFDGAAGWLGNTGRQAREMSAAEAAAAGLDAEFALALRLKEIFPQVRRGRPEEIGGVPCESLNASKPGGPVVRLYFDKSSGLPVRMVRYAETPAGRNPTQIDYADYRDVGGVKVPMRWTLARPNGRFTIQIAEVKANVPVADERFAKPAGEVK